jgi:hypothetical protein
MQAAPRNLAKAPLVGAAVLVCSGATGVLACDQGGHFRASHVGGSFVQVQRDRLVIQHGVIGAEPHKSEGTFALVDAHNPLEVDLHVTLGGELRDAAGHPLGTLNPESLRIPAGGQRTFALVHHRAKLPSARSAEVRVLSAQLATHPPGIELADANVYRDGERVVVAANLINRSEREAIVLVFAGFYDRVGALLQRPFSVVRIPGKTTRPARFVGPNGSAKGYLFVGDQVY